MVHPIALGGGKRLFAEGADPSGFALIEAKQTGDVAILTLRRER